MEIVNRQELRIALIRAGKKQWELAAALGCDPATLSMRLAGTRSAPPGFVGQIERALGLNADVLLAHTRVARPKPVRGRR